ncbi:hypothetical protein ETR_21692 [Erwinia tracheiphila PSU-1]|uniref:rhamnan synthesis F family protein n=1 Tax=Erwinia tracheiphila TaxID=65700 RepID=UPI000336E0E5|nr:rhamnan synthesis F family protein [Erwinia tracheiphila]EOS92956.1 hypothetical protein ETR_21692 [Erwinia tracheiphila PSU-1]
MPIINKKCINPLINFYLRNHFLCVSLIKAVKTKSKKDIILENKNSTKLLLIIALNKKGSLRKDIEGFLKKMKEKGAGIIAVNACSLEKKEIKRISALIDIYIETDDIGRSFASYKECFDYIYKNQMNQHCKRLIMCNDSVFYSSHGLNDFVDTMITTEKNVLGATENHACDKYLDSYFISFSGGIINNEKFIAYWRKYKKTDSKHKIKSEGEIHLSQVLQSISMGNKDFVSLYNISGIERSHNDITSIVDLAFAVSMGKHSCEQTTLLKDKFCQDKFIASYFKKYSKEMLPAGYQHSQSAEKKGGNTPEKNLHSMLFMQWLNHLKTSSPQPDKALIHALKGRCLEFCVEGSQIHLNAIILKKWGCRWSNLIYFIAVI